MANLSKISIPTALPASSKLDLSCDHVTTMDFGKIQPVHYRHPIKGEHLNMSGVGTIRPFPLATATYGRMRLNLRNFYVPWRVVFPQFDSFYNDTIAVNASNASLITNAPTFLNSDVVTLYTTSLSLYASEIANWSSGDPYDFRTGTSGSYKYYRFSSLGKDFYKLLCSLGYEINWEKTDTVAYSALPLLAYVKIYIDYYANQSYLDSQDVIEIKKILTYNDPVTPLVLSVSQIAILAVILQYACYDQDYFVGAWDNPFAPNSGQYSAITFNDIANIQGYTGSLRSTNSMSLNGTPLMVQNTPSALSLGSQYLHDALKAITDYSKRHQLAGASNISRALAQYGFGVTPMQYDRALYLGGQSIDIKTGAVFSTADTSNGGTSTLGDFAGNGYGNGSSGFDYRVDELGIQITIGSIMPSGGYFQGTDENNFHITKRSFFNPEFDGLAVQSIRKREIYVSRNADYGLINGSVDYDSSFGITGRYGEYKRPRSWVSGDLRVPTRYLGGDAWHLMREFDDDSFANGIADQYHSLGFTRMIDGDTYRRIFTYTQGDNDPFVAEFHFSVGSQAPCRGLFEGYDFETDGNKEVSVQSNGAILN